MIILDNSLPGQWVIHWLEDIGFPYLASHVSFLQLLFSYPWSHLFTLQLSWGQGSLSKFFPLHSIPPCWAFVAICLYLVISPSNGSPQLFEHGDHGPQSDHSQSTMNTQLRQRCNNWLNYTRMQIDQMINLYKFISKLIYNSSV